MKAKSGTEIQTIIEAPFDGLRRVMTELCPTCHQPIIPDALIKPGGNAKLPLCERCKKLDGASIPASFIVEREALCVMHWRAIYRQP